MTTAICSVQAGVRGAFARRLLGFAMVSTVVLASACAGGGPLGAVGIAFSDPSEYMLDPNECTQYRQPFVNVRLKQREEIRDWAATGAAAGALAGAAAGGAIGRAANNTAAGVLIGLVGGVVAGAFAGATIGYYQDLEDRAGSTDGLRRVIDGDARADAEQGDLLSNALTELNACRLRAIEDVKTGIRAGKIGGESARAQLRAILEQTRTDDNLIASVTEGLQERADIYVSAARRSGADDVDAFVARAEAYEPVVQRPSYTARTVRGVTVQSRRTSGETGTEAVLKTNAELSAMQKAHVASAEESVAAAELLII
ncbi:hypothetical protein P2H44_25235 [Albimonas sp. CAU 1670]|uniref:hypothetical protein n=1 Tax=Albimonas sp. CAU 1670 TaxID=3032599 RepID=UPI0023DB726D|nr:hypothetical protein [Albimonas sp. CAU 1670]MDF2235870.1 hypothetical protein [Albimonas sp. CAU 1670]